MNQELLQSALDLAARGFRVFPLVPGTKRPAIDGWQTKATSDPEVIRKVWSQRDYNIGVRTGDGLVVVDIDVKSNKPGVASWKALGIDERETFVVSTPSGGFHVYFEGDADSSVDRLGPGLDVRGVGGYVVGPGSVYKNGSGSGAYRVLHDHPLRPCPLVEHLRDRRLRQRNDLPVADLDDAGAVKRAIDYLKNDAALAYEGSGGDATTYKVAATLKDYGLSESVALELLGDHWNERCVPPWDHDDLAVKVGNAYRYGLEPPGAAHPSLAFGDVEIVDPPRAPSVWFRHGDAWDRNIAWLYYEAVPAVGVAAVIGATQSGKTFLEIELARSLATGKPFFGIAPDAIGGSIFLFAGSEGSGFPLRLDALEEPAPLPISMTIVRYLSEKGALGSLLEKIREEAALMQMTFGVPLKMVALETLSASGLITDENNNAEASRAIANLGTLAQQLGVLFLISAHPAKGGAGIRGASAVPAAIDYALEIKRDGHQNLRELWIDKARNAEQRMLGTFTLLKKDLGKDSRGRPVTSMTVSMGEAIADVRKSRRSTFAEELMQAIEFVLMENGEFVEGHKAAEWDAVFRHFVELKPGSKDRSNVVGAFKRTVEYACDIGAIESGVFAGQRFLWRTTDEHDPE